MMKKRTLLTLDVGWPYCLIFLMLMPFTISAANQQTQVHSPTGLATPVAYDLWPNEAPGEVEPLGNEVDTTKPDDEHIAGRPIIRLTNVTVPQLSIYHPERQLRTGTAVIVAPGGGHWILAYDLEGTEIAQWLNSIGITAIVLKYRVPGHAWNKEQPWLAAAQDGQRAVSFIRGRAKELGIAPDKIGIMGFSAGGTPVMNSAFAEKRLYTAQDQFDAIDFRPNFAAPIYTAGLPATAIYSHQSPPVFMLATSDDEWVDPAKVMETYVRLHKAGVSAELHLYKSGGHGFGLRKTHEPVTNWPQRMEEWMRHLGFIM